MEENIVKGSLFVSHFEAIKQIPDPAEQAAMYEAIFNYQFYGTMPENLPPIANLLMTAIFPVLEKEVSRKSGGRLGKAGAEEIAAKVKELGGKKAAAAFFGVSERTIYNKLSEIEKNAPEAADELHCNFSEIEENKEERRKKNEERENVEREKDKQAEKQEEREGAQSAPVELQAAPALPVSGNPPENSVLFPTKQAVDSPQYAEQPQEKQKQQKSAAFVAPTVEEVAAYCSERNNGMDAEAFVAFYASKGWMVGKNRMKDWRQAVITWEKRERKDAQAPYQARSSPAPVAVQRENSGWHSNHTVF